MFRSASQLACTLALVGAAATAQAQVTYTYTGEGLNSFSSTDASHPVSTAPLVASFVFSTFLPANAGATDNFELFTPLSFSISGGGYSLQSSELGATLSSDGLAVFTGSDGAVQGWDFLAYPDFGNFVPGARFRSFFYPTGQYSNVSPAIKTDAVTYWNLPIGISSGENTSITGGSWSVSGSPSAVPEPASVSLWLAGLALLAHLAQRRLQA